MELGIIGLPSSGKSAVFDALTEGHHEEGKKGDDGTQLGTLTVHDPRFERLCEIYHPRRQAPATFTCVDFVGRGRSRDEELGRFRATDALVSFAEGDLLRTLLMGLKRFTKYTPTNVKAARRKIAAVLIEANEYCF